MCTVVVLAGDIIDYGVFAQSAKRAKHLICADGGARHLRRIDVRPDRLIGDLDSIEAVDLEWLTRQQVPIERHAVRKNETDGELAILAALKDDASETVVVFGAFGSRPDHVLGLQLLVADLATSAQRFCLTDGVNTIQTLVGGQSLTLEQPDDQRAWAVSLVVVSETITGLNYRGLSYPLNDASLKRGSTRGISNSFAPGQTEAVISLACGRALVILTLEQ